MNDYEDGDSDYQYEPPREEPDRWRPRSLGFNRPAGVSVLDHMDALLAQGKSLDEAVKEICG